MKFAATILLLAIGAACISAQNATIWGDVKNTRVMGERAITVTSSWSQVTERIIEYHSFGSNSIRGIMHLDYKTKSRVKPSFVQGGIGHNFAAVKIVSERSHGINSTIRFYG